MGFKLMANGECWGRSDTREGIEKILRMRMLTRDGRPITPMTPNDQRTAASKLDYTIVEDP